MRLNRRRGEPIKETQMISLADIAFLIIFFFMLTSTFMRDRLTVTLPELARTAKSTSPITVVMDKQGRVYLDGQPVGGVLALEGELKGRLAGKTDPRECEVRFRCEKTLTFKDYRPVYEAISHAGGVIAIMHDTPE